jgi:hypothetical protein
MGLVRLNAVLGAVVVTVGFWLIWSDLAPTVAAAFALAVAWFLAWRGRGPRHTGQPVAGQMGGGAAAVWAWATLLLGIECVAWPFVTMVQIRMVTDQPSETQMGEILRAVLFGVFSGVFWMTLSYGIFKRMVWKKTEV